MQSHALRSDTFDRAWAHDTRPSARIVALDAPPRGKPPQAGVGEPRSRFALGLAVSLALHGLLALAWLGVGSTRPPPRHDQLLVELFGMVGKRQTEQQRRGDETERLSQEQPTPQTRNEAPTSTPKPAPRPTTKPPPREAAKPAPPAPSPVQTAATQAPSEPQPVQQAQPAPGARPPSDEPAAVHGVRDQQIQQTVSVREAESSAMRRYLSELQKLIQRNLAYPDEARENAFTGSPKIRFVITENGDILPGSLAIERSCGHALLDEAALRAARDSTPLPRPPRQMSVAIAVSFVREN